MTIDEIKKLLSEISPGPWKMSRGEDIYANSYYVGSIKGNDLVTLQDHKNLQFIVSSPEIVRFLLEKIKSLEKEIIQVKESKKIS